MDKKTEQRLRKIIREEYQVILSEKANYTVKNKKRKDSHGDKIPVYILDIGEVGVGNNHRTDHLMKAIAEREDADDILDEIGEFEWDDEEIGAEVVLKYTDTRGGKYEDTWDSGELYDELNQHM